VERETGGNEVNYDRAMRALGARGATLTCPFCGTDAWHRLGDLGNLGVFLEGTMPDWQPVRTGEGAGGIAAYVLICKNCGFIRLHAREVLHQAE
jgi:hypothetical protein